MPSTTPPLPNSLPVGARTTISAAAALLYVIVPACAGDESAAGGDGDSASLTGFSTSVGETGSTDTMGTDSFTGTDSDTDPASTTDSTTDDPTDDSTGGDGDGSEDLPPIDCEGLECGPGSCVILDSGFAYCECPPDSIWQADSCEACPTVVAGSQPLQIEVVRFTGRFLLDNNPPPTTDFDDAYIFLENTVSGDRVALGNTRTGEFDVRVTPGIYELVFEVDNSQGTMPRNPHIAFAEIALFETTLDQPVNIPAVMVGGDITLDGAEPPTTDFDDGHLFLRDPSGHELYAGTTRDGAYEVLVVPGTYELIYRVDSRGEFIPHNDGAVLASGLVISADTPDLDVHLQTATITGSFQLNGNPAPPTDFDDANIGLESPSLGFVPVGNTHDPEYSANVLVGDEIEEDYRLVYMHENGSVMPRNTRALLESFPIDEDNPVIIDIPALSLSGALTLNGVAPPQTDFDDGLVHLHGIDSEDRVPLGNTNEGAYDVQVLPGTYAIYYSSQSAGGLMPENTSAYLGELPVNEDTVAPIDVPAVSVSGVFTLGEQAPPSSVYEDGRIFLRNERGDTVLLGNTHEGGYAARVVPGSYELYYVQEAGGDVPNNQNARIGALEIVGEAMDGVVDIPVTDLSGQFLRFEGFEQPQPTPNSAADGGQIYLRSLTDDVALLGDSFAQSYEARLVSGTYGVYYRSEASVTMPENENGRFSCITLE